LKRLYLKRSCFLKGSEFPPFHIKSQFDLA
jgi:hypothetical protein